MKRLKKLTILLFVTLVVNINSSTEASQLDYYKELLLNKVYTIRYENITPAPRVTNRDKTELFGKNGLAVEKNDYLTNKQIIGIITSNGEDRYEEVGDGNFNMCRLTKGNENFLFTKYKKNNTYEYFGSKKGKVEANARNYLAEILEGQSYGDPEVTSLLNAILPDSKKSANLPKYKFVTSGKLDSGLIYEDYASKSQENMSVIRYYFREGVLVKISSASYRRKLDGKLEGSKCIIKIISFSDYPEMKLLNLPDGLKDVTKRNGE